ncbi:hypothetical protein VNO77_22895 [Canavalia gladiata]|uniref:Uncharacterized protein n=1 Tax=Canavalia gladiata TaxID=3824 RepID=A0AAN9Q8E6_CANGL
MGITRLPDPGSVNQLRWDVCITSGHFSSLNKASEWALYQEHAQNLLGPLTHAWLHQSWWGWILEALGRVLCASTLKRKLWLGFLRGPGLRLNFKTSYGGSRMVEPGGQAAPSLSHTSHRTSTVTYGVFQTKSVTQDAKYLAILTTILRFLSPEARMPQEVPSCDHDREKIHATNPGLAAYILLTTNGEGNG